MASLPTPLPRGRRLPLLAIAIAVTLVGCDEDTIEPLSFGTLTGETLTREGDAPVEGVTLTTTPAGSVVVSDAGGRFRFGELPVGTYSVRAEREGYVPQAVSVSVFVDREASLVLRLVRDTLDAVPPLAPALLAPADGAADLGREVRLAWAPPTGEDAPEAIRYRVLLFGPDDPEAVVLATDLADTTFLVSGLDYGTGYRWQVAADDGRNAPTFGPVRTFRTAPLPDFRLHFARERDGRYDIYAGDGLGEEVRLTDDGSSNWRPRVSPRRDAVAFVSNRGVRPQIYLMDRDGGGVRQVTTVPIAGADLLELDFAWSPDGSRLLYPSGRQLIVVNADGTGQRVFAQAPPGFTFAECDWTAQGGGPEAAGFVAARLVGQRAYQSRVSLYATDGSPGREVVGDGPGAVGGPRISIAGTRVLYTEDAAGFEDLGGRQLDARVYETDLVTGETVDRSGDDKPAGTNDLDAVYSPDGSRVVFVNANNDGLSGADLYTVTLDEEGERVLLIEDAVMPEWK